MSVSMGLAILRDSIWIYIFYHVVLDYITLFNLSCQISLIKSLPALTLLEYLTARSLFYFIFIYKTMMCERFLLLNKTHKNRCINILIYVKLKVKGQVLKYETITNVKVNFLVPQIHFC